VVAGIAAFAKPLAINRVSSAGVSRPPPPWPSGTHSKMRTRRAHQRAASQRPQRGLRAPLRSRWGDLVMTAMDLVGLALILLLVVPMITARPSRY